jgi:hypothetical protein
MLADGELIADSLLEVESLPQGELVGCAFVLVPSGFGLSPPIC